MPLVSAEPSAVSVDGIAYYDGNAVTSMDAADPLADALAAFDRDESRYAPLTTSEVAAELDCTRRTAYNRLDRLAERGDLETEKVGARGRVWWRPPGESDAAESKHAGAERKLLDSTVRSIAEAETFEDGLRATLREVCEVTVWEQRLDPVSGGEALGRIVLADGESVVLGSLPAEDPDEPRTETAITGEGANNPLVALVGRLLRSDSNTPTETVFDEAPR